MGNKKYFKGKHPLLLFSGGNDSTLMLKEALEASHVYTLYVDAGQGELKAQMELKARAEIFQILKNESPHSVLSDWGVKELRDLNSFHGQFMRFRQVLPWIIAALYKADPDRVSEVQIGYILGDSITIRLETIKKLWKQLWNLVNFDKPLIPLRFPLIEKVYNKSSVLDKLPENLLSKTWVCEIPSDANNKVKPCGSCQACLTLLGAKAKINVEKKKQAINKNQVMKKRVIK